MLNKLSAHLLPCFAEYRVDEIDESLVEEYIDDKVRENAELAALEASGRPPLNRAGRPHRQLKPATINTHLHLLAEILDRAVRDGHLARNPARGEDLRLAVRREHRYGLELDEAWSLIEAAGKVDRQGTRSDELREQIVERLGQPDEIVISRYGVGEFPGEISLLTGQQAFLTAVVRTAGRAIRVSPETVHIVMEQEPDLSELILRALLARHARLTTHGAGLTLIGSRFDPNARRLLSVLARNRLSSRWLDIEESSEVDALLRRLSVAATQLPIVLTPGNQIMRNPSSGQLLRSIGLAQADELETSCELVVVGGGPAGLAAAVYAASAGGTPDQDDSATAIPLVVQPSAQDR